MTSIILDDEMDVAGGRFLVNTRHSQYIIDTEAHTATRNNVFDNNPLHGDGTPMPYTHIECLEGAPLVMLYHKPGTGDVWRSSTDVISIERLTA